MRRGIAGMVAAVVVTSVALTACSGGDDSISDAARNELAPLTQRVRSSLDAFDPAGAAAATAAVRQTVERLRGQGEIGDERADAILSAVAGVEHRLDLAPTTTTTTTTLPPPPTPTVKGPKGDQGNEGNGNGKGGKD